MASSVVSRSGGEAVQGAIQLSGPCGASQARVADLQMREVMAIHAKKKCTHYKNLLQELAQGNKLSLPFYKTEAKGDPHRYEFVSTVEVGGKLFRSHQWHRRRKDAEQDVARVAYESLVTVDDDPTDHGDPTDDDDPTDADDHTDVLGLIDQDVVFCKSILHEFAAKTKATQPEYSLGRPEGLAALTMFVSSVLFDGKTYIGEAATNKKDAEQKAARNAVKSILATNNNCMKEIIRSKKQLIIAITSAGFNKERAVAAFPTVDQGADLIPAADSSAQAIYGSKKRKKNRTT